MQARTKAAMPQLDIPTTCNFPVLVDRTTAGTTAFDRSPHRRSPKAVPDHPTAATQRPTTMPCNGPKRSLS